MTLRALAVLAAAALAGCGTAERESKVVAGPKLTVSVSPRGPDGPSTTRSVTCPGSPACDVPLDAVGTTACADIYGGSATAKVSGVLEGEAVDAEFDLTNSCEIDRWREASALLGDPPPYAP